MPDWSGQPDFALMQAAWSGWWDLVEGETAHATGVEAALPWRTAAVGIESPLEDLAFALPGPQRVTWIGYDPARGLVHGERVWDPDGHPRPLLPEVWEALSYETYHARVKTPLARAVDGEHQYRSLPLPSWVAAQVPHDDAAEPVAMSWQVRHFLAHAGGPSFGRLTAVLGLPPRVVNQMQRSYHADDLDQDVPSSYLGRTPATMAGLLWCTGNDVRGSHPWHLGMLQETPADAGEALPAAVLRARRVQAVMSMPCFAWAMDQGHTAAVVDAGGELVPHLAERLGCQPSTVRILGAASAGMDGPGLACMGRSIASTEVRAMLDGMPRSTLRDLVARMPSEGWQGIRDLSSQFYYSQQPPSVVRAVGARLRPDPGAGWDWLVPPEGGDRWEHLDDVVEQLSRDLLWAPEALADPVAEDRNRRDLHSARTLVLSGLASLGPRRLAAVLDAHMAGALRRAAEVSAAGEGSAVRWAVPAEPVVVHTGQVVRFLASAHELAEEGLKLDHCVGDYADACETGRCAVMSIGRWVDGEWAPSSTVELARSDDDGIEVVQHHGQGNREPPEGDVEVLRRWMAGLGTGETLFDLEVLPPPSTLAHIGRALGNAWHTPELAEARWDRWRRILDVRQRTAGAFLAHAVQVTGLLDGDSPVRAGVARLVETVVDHDRRMALVPADLPPAIELSIPALRGTAP